MTDTIIAAIEAGFEKLAATFKPEVKAVETDTVAIGSAALAYISTNGLKDLYTIALTALTNVATGTSYPAVLAEVVAQGEAAGITIAKGAESVVVAQAQADLIATGTIPPVVALAAAPAVAGVPVPTPAPVAPAALTPLEIARLSIQGASTPSA